VTAPVFFRVLQTLLGCNAALRGQSFYNYLHDARGTNGSVTRIAKEEEAVDPQGITCFLMLTSNTL